MNKLLPILLAVVLSGCATGPKPLGLATDIISNDMTRLIISRDDAFLYMGLDAQIYVNGELIVSLGRNDKHYHDIEPGRVTMSVQHPQSSGRYSISFNSLKGKQLKFIISPRGESYIPALTLGVLGGMLDASINEQSGFFKIIPSTSN